MQFVDRDPTQEAIRGSIVNGLISISVIVPMYATIAILYHARHPWRSPWGITAVALSLGAVAFACVHIAVQARRGRVEPPPNVTFGVIAAQLVAMVCVVIAAHASLAYYLPAVIVVVMFTSQMGDRSMRLVALGVSVACVATAGWEEGQRGAGLATLIVMYAWIGAIAVICTGAVMEGLVRITASQRGISRIASVIAEADSVAEGLCAVLPLVPLALPTDRAILGVRNERGEVTVLDAWPGPAAGDADVLARPELIECLECDTPVLRDGHCFVQVGFTGTSQLILVVRLRRRRGESRLHVTETAATLAATLLRLTSRVAFVTALHLESRTDPLTGLPNRRRLLDRLETDLIRAERNRRDLCVGMVDIDHFKRYNDTYGHVEGDRMLRSVAAVMATTVRRQDLLARYGGEEFILVLPDTDLDGAREAAEKVRHEAKAAGGPETVTISVGLAAWDGTEEPTTLIGRADGALYEAKRSGRNRVVVKQLGCPVDA